MAPSAPILGPETYTDPRVRSAEIRRAVKQAKRVGIGTFLSVMGMVGTGTGFMLQRMDRKDERSLDAVEVMAKKAETEARAATMKLEAVGESLQDVKAEQRETRTDIKDLYRAFRRGQRSSRLERPLPAEEP